ncbi:MAG: radical SAM-associated putative lipoprotein [Bacteroidales bacterium]|nr:radical SAM-associated putative lipoprotein [Bacteroidales bacterium]MDD4670326.1 radical SAM-associated putative lipoprotein [Bacteroidales bacterium]
MKMKRHYGIKALFLMLLSAIGMTSCNGLIETIGGQLLMYGSPTANYRISGKVKDEAGKGINGIQVVVGWPMTYMENINYFRPIDTLYTDSNGNYSFSETMPQTNIRILANDVDGEGNGGKFKSDSINISNIKFTGGDGSWYKGEAILENQDITLKKE